jgi:hypothetical protein
MEIVEIAIEYRPIDESYVRLMYAIDAQIAADKSAKLAEGRALGADS